MRVVLLLVASLLVGGCAAPLPTYAPMEASAAWRIVAERASSIRGVTSEADTTLTGDDGTSLRVDAALLLAPPDRLRLRAWKLGHAVLDVTGDGGVVWVDAPEVPEARGGADALGVEPAALVRGLLLVPGWAFARREPVRAERRADRYVYELDTPDGPLTCEVDVRTLAVRRWRVEGGQTLELSAHRLVDGVAWPGTAVLRDGARSVRLRFRDVALDAAPDERVFAAPAGARRLP